MSEVIDLQKTRVLLEIKVSPTESYKIVMPSKRQVKEMHTKFKEAGEDAEMSELVVQELIATMGLPVAKQEDLPADVSTIIMNKLNERTDHSKK